MYGNGIARPRSYSYHLKGKLDTRLSLLIRSRVNMNDSFLRSYVMKKMFAALMLAFFLCFTVSTQTVTDGDLKAVKQLDSQDRDAKGNLKTLPAEDHIRRGFVYLDNRQFPAAREHFSRVIDAYPTDPLLSRALFGLARSFMWEKRYVSAITYFARLSSEFPDTKDGRDGLAFMGACYVRIGKNDDAAQTYERYTVAYPTGEKIDSAYLNIIDALRESGRYDEALRWVEKTLERFDSTPTAVNAMHARLRLEISRRNWNGAVTAADELLKMPKLSGSMTTDAEVRYLRAFSLENAGKRTEAVSAYSAIPDTNGNYWGGLASEKLASLSRLKRTTRITSTDLAEYPIMFRNEVLQYSKPDGIDPRFVLALMKQESSFRPGIKSPSAARGLLQLVIDTALKYSDSAGFHKLAPDDLYKPSVNVAIGCAYIADLKNQFGGLNEAIAASYNGGEDNARRWLNRTNSKDPGIFTSEIGFAETKNYVFKVMSFYRIYTELYDKDLNKK